MPAARDRVHTGSRGSGWEACGGSCYCLGTGVGGFARLTNSTGEGGQLGRRTESGRFVSLRQSGHRLPHAVCGSEDAGTQGAGLAIPMCISGFNGAARRSVWGARGGARGAESHGTPG